MLHKNSYIHDDAVIDCNLQLFENRLPENTGISNFRTWLKYLLDWSKWFQNLNTCYLAKAFLHAMGDSYFYFVSGNETNRKKALFSARSSEMKMASQANIVRLKYKMLVIILKTLKVPWHLPTLLFQPAVFSVHLEVFECPCNRRPCVPQSLRIPTGIS